MALLNVNILKNRAFKSFDKDHLVKFAGSGLGSWLNGLQTLFIGILRIWSIPIVLLLSLSSGFTTYYGLSHFILPWIALILTIAIQSVIVICSLELASIHWKANRLRFLSVLIPLLLAIAASVTFSYFKFYEISQSESIHISRVDQIRRALNQYLTEITAAKSAILKQQKERLDAAGDDVTQAYFGTHPLIDKSNKHKHEVGQGPFWRHYNQIYQGKKKQFENLEQAFAVLDQSIRRLEAALNGLEAGSEAHYRQLQTRFQDVQLQFNRIAAESGAIAPTAPILMTHAQFVQNMTPSFSMWQGFSLFAFICAAMGDFFCVLLAYRLESTAPGPLTEQEQELMFECIKQFTEFKINDNDELEMVIEKSELEKARRYSDWTRMFAVGFLLNRGFLRKIDHKTVEFAPNFYPLIAERMASQLRALKTQAAAKPAAPNPKIYEVEHE